MVATAIRVLYCGSISVFGSEVLESSASSTIESHTLAPRDYHLFGPLWRRLAHHQTRSWYHRSNKGITPAKCTQFFHCTSGAILVQSSDTAGVFWRQKGSANKKLGYIFNYVHSDNWYMKSEEDYKHISADNWICMYSSLYLPAPIVRHPQITQSTYYVILIWFWPFLVKAYCHLFISTCH